MYYLATSKVCLIDTYIIPVSILNHKKELTIIQLCHGIGNIKKFGYQTLKNESGKNEKSTIAPVIIYIRIFLVFIACFIIILSF